MSVTIEDMEKMVQSIAAKRAEIDSISLRRSLATTELDELELRMMTMLEDAGKHDYKSEVGTVFITSRESVKIPRELEDKRKLFEYLKGKGLFEEMVGVNSQTLNSFYKAEKKAAEERGEWNFELPGVGEPTTDLILSFRKTK